MLKKSLARTSSLCYDPLVAVAGFSIFWPPSVLGNRHGDTRGSFFMPKIPLTQGQFALVDDEDFKRFNNFKWCAKWEKNTKSYHARRGVQMENKKVKTLALHREILGVTDPRLKVDHKNHDTLDNRRDNLRVCTTSQNAMNRKGARSNSFTRLRGVTKNRRRFMARISLNGKDLYLGTFSTATEASAADAAANRRYFGEFGGNI